MPVLETFQAQGDRRGQRLELTPTHVRQVIRRWGVYHSLSLPLSQVTSINYSARMPVGCLLLALLGGATVLLCVSMAHFGGPVHDRLWWQASVYVGGFALVALGAFQLGRQQELVIATATERIHVQCSAVDAAALKEFGESVERQQSLCLAGEVAAPLGVLTPPAACRAETPGPAAGRRPKLELSLEDDPPRQTSATPPSGPAGGAPPQA